MKTTKIVVCFKALLISCFLKGINCDNPKVIKYSSTKKPLQSDFQFANFFKIHDKYLNVQSFKTLQAKTYKKCLADCAADQKCISFNFAKRANSDGLHLCEMLDTDLFNATLNSTDDFKDSANHQHFTRKTQCLSMPCSRQNPGLRCVPDYFTDTYTCKTCKEMGELEGLTEWSEWSRCDKLCEDGKKRRERTCNSKAVCNPCNATIITQEEKECYFCAPESHIKMNDHYGDLCLQPTSGDCNPPDNYEIEMKTASDANCSAEYRRFLIDGKGKIYHKCSNKIVCSKPDWNGVQYPEAARRLVLSDNCPEDIAKHKRLSSHLLQNTKNEFCVHPEGGTPRDNVLLTYADDCRIHKRLMFHFFVVESPIRAAYPYNRNDGTYLCLQPQSGDCNPIENKTTWSHGLVWKHYKDCSTDYMAFMLDDLGKLYHKCSGKIVCVGNGDGTYPWNIRLVLKDKCPDDVARHKRLSSQGLQHVKSGLCVHTFGGHPGDGKYLVYDRTCPDEKRFQLLFFKPAQP